MTEALLLAYVVLLVLFGATLLVNAWTGIPYVPSRTHIAKKLIEHARLRKGETVFDLGCGDGRLLTYAAKSQEITAIGYEIAPMVYLAAELRRLLSKNRKKIDIRFESMFRANLKKANVIFVYLMPKILPKIAEKIMKECKPGTRIISNTFKIPGLKLIKRVPKRRHYPTIYVYEIQNKPALFMR